MEKTAFLTVQASVETQNVDFLGLWRPSRMLEHLIDTASRHAAILGYSYEDLVQQRIVWVLSRLNVHFYRRPGIGEEVMHPHVDQGHPAEALLPARFRNEG